jgi:uncharacterized protein YecT (DUF1311 family)
MLKYLAGLLLFSAATFASAQDSCDKAYSTPDVNLCARKDLDRAEIALNKTYQSVLAELLTESKNNPDAGEARKRLINAQREWVQFREDDCQAIFTLWRSGTVRTLQYLTCMQNHAEQRTREFGNYVPGSEP